MIKTFRILALMCALIFFASIQCPAADWEFSAHTGQAFATAEKLRFKHHDGRTTSFRACPETKPFKMPIYWDLRVGRFDGDSGWEIELMHDKMYVTNLPEEIDHFEISHGYNHIWINRAWRTDLFTYRFGIGPVLAHPTISADGRSNTPSIPSFLDKTYMEGSQLSGMTTQAAIQKTFPLGWGMAFSLEAKASLSYAHIEAAGGEVRVPRKAVHFLAGLVFGN